MQASGTEGRTVVLARAPGALSDQAAACLTALGCQSILLELDGRSGPEVADLKEQGRLGPALDRVAGACGTADAIVFVGRDLREGEDVAEFIEESIASYHFYLKLAKRLRVNGATDVLALAPASAVGEDAALAADIRNGALRQMSKVAASEGGPMAPPLLVNTLFVSGEPRAGASGSLKALLARLLARPQGYVTGTELRVRL